MRPEDIDGRTVGTLLDLVQERYPVMDSGKIQKYRNRDPPSSAIVYRLQRG